METQITVKVKLKLQSSETASNFTKTMELYRQACNFVSDSLQFPCQIAFCLRKS